MTVYLNTERPTKNYQELVAEKYFVDKSLIIELINERINTKSKYVCITRPRRFGKSSVADMLGSYYCKCLDTSDIFSKLKISKVKGYEAYLNKYNVISISFNEITDHMKTYEQYINNIVHELKKEIMAYVNNKGLSSEDSLKRILEKSGEKYIFILDEWDYIFSNHLFVENQNDFLEFLRNLLKDEPYVALCYMTGVLPIKKYSSGSALNMFDEFTMLNDMLFGEYFGFTEEEVKMLCAKQSSLDFEALKEWYNGYLSEEGQLLYNPRSVIKALQSKKCKGYWTNTGAMDEVAVYLKYNTLEVREDIIEMVAGGQVDLFIEEEFRAGQEAPKTKEEIYSAMIILGFLSYHEGYLKIPNKELMHEFEKALKDEAFCGVAKIIKDSREMLRATLYHDTEAMEEILHRIHNSEIPILQYNDENSLACILTLAYLSARDSYRVEREEKTGKGYADFIFYPRRKNDYALIVELKKDEVPEVALHQIKHKEYAQKLIKENKTQKILAVAICYDSKNKEHHCKIEEL